MRDDPRILRIESLTFADESFRAADPSGLVVLAQLPDWCELRWHNELLQKCGPELKWGKVRSRWRDLSADLRRSVLRDLRDALIAIEDRSLDRFKLEEAIAASVRVPKQSWSGMFQASVADHVKQFERQSILWDSPAFRIQTYLENDGDLLLDVGDTGASSHEDDSVISAIDARLLSVESVRFFGARSAATFPHLIDRDIRVKAFEEARAEGRFFSRGYVDGLVFAHGERVHRVFDSGNKPSVSAIVDLKGAIRERLVDTGQLVIPDNTPVGASEKSSAEEPMLQAADLAAGYARALYLNHGDQGLRVVCEEFKGVIFNGSMVRDWSQVERANLTELRR